jgi:hypothetical protein
MVALEPALELVKQRVGFRREPSRMLASFLIFVAHENLFGISNRQRTRGATAQLSRHQSATARRGTAHILIYFCFPRDDGRTGLVAGRTPAANDQNRALIDVVSHPRNNSPHQR